MGQTAVLVVSVFLGTIAFSGKLLVRAFLNQRDRLEKLEEMARSEDEL